MDTDWTVCSKCNLGVLPPWYGCGTGHIVCDRCFNLLEKNFNYKTCPKCKYLFISNKRNLLEVLENIAKSTPGITTKCVNKECKEKVHLDALKSHVGKCKFSKIFCRICSESFPRDDMWQHYLDKHTDGRVTQFTLNSLKDDKIYVNNNILIEKGQFRFICINIKDTDVTLRVIINVKFEKPCDFYMYCDLYKLSKTLDGKRICVLFEEFSNNKSILSTIITCEEGLISSHMMKHETDHYELSFRLFDFNKRTSDVAGLTNSNWERLSYQK